MSSRDPMWARGGNAVDAAILTAAGLCLTAWWLRRLSQPPPPRRWEEIRREPDPYPVALPDDHLGEPPGPEGPGGDAT